MNTYTWDEAKRKTNLRKHGLDFMDACLVVENNVYIVEDTRFLYNERRYNAYGYLGGRLVCVTFSEANHEVRVISFRKTTRRETFELLGRSS